MSGPADKVVDVLITPTESGCEVKPGDVVVESDNWINFINDTNAPIRIQFFEDGLFSSAFPEKLDSKGKWKQQIQKVERGFYPYSVYCECCNGFALGGSMPIIIIKR